MSTYLGILALVFYLLATIKLSIVTLVKNGAKRGKIQAFILGGIALMLSAGPLYNDIFVNGGLNLGFFKAGALVGWMIALITLVVATKKPVENLLIIFFPLAALALLLEMLFPNSNRFLAGSGSMGLNFHILLSILAYSLLTVATFQALLLAFQEHQLSSKKPSGIIHTLPPMQVMETLLIRMIAVGFFILSLSLATGLMFLHDIFAQHLMHKTVLSVTAWLGFGLLLWGHWYLGWRGKKLTRCTLSGFCALMLAYFGSKLVLEMILMRT